MTPGYVLPYLFVAGRKMSARENMKRRGQIAKWSVVTMYPSDWSVGRLDTNFTVDEKLLFQIQQIMSRFRATRLAWWR